MHLLIFLFAVFLASVAQIFLKISADRSYNSFWREYINVPVLTGYALFFISTLITIWAYRGLPLKIGPVLESLGYVLILGMSYLFFKVVPRWNTILGTLLIITGVVIFTI